MHGSTMPAGLRTFSRRWLRTPTVVLLCACYLEVAGCDHAVSPSIQPGSEASASRLRAQLSSLDAILEAPGEESENPKSKYFRVRSELIHRLLQNDSERRAAQELLAIAEFNEADPLARWLPELLFHVMLHKDDYVGLRELLSMVPMYVDGPDGLLIEFSLVEPFTPKPVSNILILFDAYESAESQAVKENLVSAIRRAFHDRIRPWHTDAEVIESMRLEFTREQDDLKVNPEYMHAYGGMYFEISNVIPPPLFIRKHGPESVPRKLMP